METEMPGSPPQAFQPASPTASPKQERSAGSLPGVGSPAASTPKAASSGPTPGASAATLKGAAVTRLQMLEFLNGREWWARSQSKLLFTFCLWIWFAFLMLLRADVEGLYRVHRGLEQHVTELVAHTGSSGVPLLTQAERPLPCRCSCQISRAQGRPETPCSAGTMQVLNFMGSLPEDLAVPLLAAHDGVLGPEPEVPALAWREIASLEQAWFWLEHGLLPDLWGTSGGQSVRRSGLVLRKNLMIGGLRARQHRARLAPECSLPSELLQSYGASCRSTAPQTGPYGPAGSFAPAAGASAEEGDYDALFDVERNLSHALETAATLRKQGWLGAETQWLELEALLLNAEAAAYGLLSVHFEVPFQGRVRAEVRVRTFPAPTSSGFSWADGYPEIVWVCIIVIVFLQEAWAIVSSVRKGRIQEYFVSLWTYVEWVLIWLGVAIVFFWYVMLSELSLMTDQIATLPLAPLPPNLELSSYENAWAAVLDRARSVHVLRGYHSLTMFCCTMLISARLLRSCMGQEKLAMIQSTLSRAFVDVIHFVVIFAVLFANFVLSGRVLFGAELEAWSQYPQAASSSVRLLLGSSLFDEMYEARPWSATVWFWLFITTMVFLVMNLLLVITLDNFLEVHEVVGPTFGIMHDVVDWVDDLRWRLDWRKENFSESEYKAAFLDDPYAELQDGLLGASKLSDEVEQACREQCLGLRFAVSHLNDISPEGLVAGGHPGTVNTSSLELRKMGCDAMVAEHLLEKCSRQLSLTKRPDPDRQLTLMRRFVQMLQSHHDELDKHCSAFEAGVNEEEGHLRHSLEKLEGSVYGSLEGFTALRQLGVESLAPPPSGQTGMMKASGAFEHQGSRFMLTNNMNPVSPTSLAIRK